MHDSYSTYVYKRALPYGRICSSLFTWSTSHMQLAAFIVCLADRESINKPRECLSLLFQISRPRATGRSPPASNPEGERSEADEKGLVIFIFAPILNDVFLDPRAHCPLVKVL